MAAFTYLKWWQNSLEFDRTGSGTALLADNNLHCHLFTSPTTALNGSETLASFTEASFAGYAVVPLTGFTAAALEGTTDAASSCNPAAFILTSGSQTVYGYYVTDSTNGLLYWAQDFGGAIALNTSTNTVSVSPKITRHSG